jgi:hypothetical protein
MASKQRTVTGAYSEDSFGDNGPDKIRNVDWGPYEGNAVPRVGNLKYIDADNSIGAGSVDDGRSVGHKPRKLD